MLPHVIFNCAKQININTNCCVSWWPRTDWNHFSLEFQYHTITDYFVLLHDFLKLEIKSNWSIKILAHKNYLSEGFVEKKDFSVECFNLKHQKWVYCGILSSYKYFIKQCFLNNAVKPWILHLVLNRTEVSIQIFLLLFFRSWKEGKHLQR